MATPKNISDIEDHPNYERHADEVGKRPLNNRELDLLLAYEQEQYGRSDLRGTWEIVSRDGTRRPAR